MSENDQREQCKEAKFVDDNFAELIQRVTSVMPIVDALKGKGILHEEKYDEIKAEQTSQDKMRKLFESLRSGGDEVKKAFYYLLEKHEPDLFKDLGGVSKKRKLADPESPVPHKRLNTESNEQNRPHSSASINIVNIDNERRPENINNICILNKTEWNSPTPKKEQKPPAPKKEQKPPAPKKAKKPPAPKKAKKPPAPKKAKKPPAPKKAKKPPAPKKAKKPPAPKKAKKAVARK